MWELRPVAEHGLSSTGCMCCSVGCACDAKTGCGMAANNPDRKRARRAQVMHEAGSEAGIAEFICKPFRIEELQRLLLATRRVSRTL